MIDVKLDQNDLQQMMNRLQRVNVDRRPPLLVQALRTASLIIERDLKSTAPKQSGKLRQSMQSRVDRNTMSAVIGSGVRTGSRMPYANIQETGGTIRPKNAKWLTIPLDANKTRAGVTRFKARDIEGGFFKEVNGNLFLFQKKGKKITPMFILKKQVELKPSYYLTRSESRTRVMALEKLNETIERGLRQ